MLDRLPNLAAIEGAKEVYRKIAEVDPAAPLRLRFADKAQVLFERWLTDLEQRIRGNDHSPSFQSHLAKYRSLMPSLALLFAVADGCEDEVPLSLAKLACDWCDYLEYMREGSTPRRRGQNVMLRSLLVNG